MNSGNLVYSVIVGALITGFVKQPLIKEFISIIKDLDGQVGSIDLVTNQKNNKMIADIKEKITNEFIPFYVGSVVLCYIIFELLNIKENTDNRFAALIVGTIISCMLDLDVTLTFIQDGEINTIQQLTILPKIIFISITVFLMLESFKPRQYTRQSQYYNQY